jgi:hypothetical protein
MSLFLQDEINDSRGTAMQSCTGTGFMRIARKRTHERHARWTCGSIPPGNTSLPDASMVVGLERQVFSNGLNRFAFYQNIGDVIVGSRNNPSVFNQKRHAVFR